MNILVSLTYFPKEWKQWNWPGELVKWQVKTGIVDQRILPEIHAWVIDPDTSVTAPVLADLPHLQVISTASTGTNHIDKKLCENMGIDVLCLFDDRKALDKIKASSEGTFTLLLMTLKNSRAALKEIDNRRWHQNQRLLRGNELFRKTVGIIGYGRIGKNINRWCREFGAETVVYDPPKSIGPSLDDLLRRSDILVVCCNLTEETKNLLNSTNLCKMKDDAVLINTSRGEVIDEADLADLLIKRPKMRVGIDVLAGEVSGTHLTSPLLKFNNVTILPHVAGCTYESNEKAARIAMELLRKWDYLRDTEKSVP